MSDSTARALELLGLLQTYRYWSGGELAERLGVTERTLRRDVDRLRELGYRIAASRGVGGGYQLEAGSRLPPLLLTDDEVVAIAVGLRAAAVGGLADSAQLAISALAKLEQVLPERLRRRTAALAEVATPTPAAGPIVAAETVAQLALVCRDSERIRFRYTSGTGEQTRRQVEAHTVVSEGRRWYLVGYDLGRDDWRTFRVDRVERLEPTGIRVPRRRLPAETAAEMIRVAAAGQSRRFTARAIIHVAMPAFQAHFGPWGRHAEDLGDRVAWPFGGNRFEEMAGALLWIPPGWEYEVEADAEFVDFLRDSGAAFTAAGSAD